jgi:hypothetical protein
MRIIKVDGGIGRVICSTGAIQKASDHNDDVVVITAWPEVFENNSDVMKVYRDGSTPYLFDDVIKWGDFVYPEPYHSQLYYNQTHHLSQSFNWLINGYEDKLEHVIYLTEDEIEYGLSIVEKAKTASGKTKAIAFQPFGSSTILNKKGVISDPSFRSIDDIFSRKIMTECKESVFLNMSHIPINHPNCWQQTYKTREYFAVVNACDLVVTVDSLTSHLGECFHKNGVLILGATFNENVGYDRYHTFQNTGYPMSYQSNRFGGHVERNQLAMDFDENMQNRIIEAINIL